MFLLFTPLPLITLHYLFNPIPMADLVTIRVGHTCSIDYEGDKVVFNPDSAVMKSSYSYYRFDKSDFKIEVHNDMLTISSEKQTEKESEESDRYTKREFSYQAFTRSFTLPETADGDNVSANYDKGILIVSIPKKEEAKPKAPRTIEIQ